MKKGVFVPVVFLLPAFCTLVWAGSGRESSAVSPGMGGIRMANGRISADLENAPLDQVISQIREQVNIRVASPEALQQETVSVQFDDLPVAEGLKRIFLRLNYSLIYNGGGDITGVILVGRSAAITKQGGESTATAAENIPSNVPAGVPAGTRPRRTNAGASTAPVSKGSIPLDAASIPRPVHDP